MDEQEALEILYEKHSDIEMYYAEHDRYKDGDDDLVAALEIVFSMLRELEEYRKIGTIEELLQNR